MCKFDVNVHNSQRYSHQTVRHGHSRVTRLDGLAKTVLQGTVEGQRKPRRKDRDEFCFNPIPCQKPPEMERANPKTIISVVSPQRSVSRVRRGPYKMDAGYLEHSVVPLYILLNLASAQGECVKRQLCV